MSKQKNSETCHGVDSKAHLSDGGGKGHSIPYEVASTRTVGKGVPRRGTKNASAGRVKGAKY